MKCNCGWRRHGIPSHSIHCPAFGVKPLWRELIPIAGVVLVVAFLSWVAIYGMPMVSREVRGLYQLETLE